VWSREDWFISTTQRFPGPPSIMAVAEGGPVLGIGIDWAEEFVRHEASEVGWRWETFTSWSS